MKIPFSFMTSGDDTVLYIPDTPSVASSDIIGIGTLNNELSTTDFTHVGDLVTFNFTTPPTLTPGTKYAIVLYTGSVVWNASSKYVATQSNDSQTVSYPEAAPYFSDNNAFTSNDNGTTYLPLNSNFHSSYQILVDDGAGSPEMLIDALPPIPVKKGGLGRIGGTTYSYKTNFGFTFDMVGTGSTNDIKEIKLYVNRSNTLFSGIIGISIHPTTTA